MSRQGFRVMTYNLRAFRDDWRAAAHAVRMVGPDVLCLQEVSRTWFPTRRTRAFAAARSPPAAGRPGPPSRRQPAWIGRLIALAAAAPRCWCVLAWW